MGTRFGVIKIFYFVLKKIKSSPVENTFYDIKPCVCGTQTPFSSSPFQKHFAHTPRVVNFLFQEAFSLQGGEFTRVVKFPRFCRVRKGKMSEGGEFSPPSVYQPTTVAYKSLGTIDLYVCGTVFPTQ